MSAPTSHLLALDGQGVVFNNPFPMFLSDLGLRIGISEQQITTRWSEELRVPFWTGQLSETEMWARLAPGLSASDLRTDLERRYAPGPLFDLVRRSTGRLWLLSNHRGNWLRLRLERFGLTERFERVFVSDELGNAKPSPKVFANLAGSGCLYIDDAMQNVEVARSLGIEAIHVDEAIRRLGGWAVGGEESPGRDRTEPSNARRHQATNVQAREESIVDSR